MGDEDPNCADTEGKKKKAKRDATAGRSERPQYGDGFERVGSERVGGLAIRRGSSLRVADLAFKIDRY